MTTETLTQAGSHSAEAMMKGRKQTLQLVLPLLSLICLLGAFVIVPAGPLAHAIDSTVFLVAGMLLLGLMFAQRYRGLSSMTAAVTSVMTIFLLISYRISSFYTGPTYDDPQVSVLHAIYFYVPLLFMMLTLMLPHPTSGRVASLMWLSIAVLTTALSRPLWSQNPPREGLIPMLVMMWAGYPIYLLLLVRFARVNKDAFDLLEGETRHALEAQKAGEQFALELRSIFNQAAVGIAMLDADGRWMSVNQRICQITGYSAEELMQTDFQSITHPEDLSADMMLAAQLMRREIASYVLEKRYLRKDGGIVWINLSVTRIDGAGGQKDRFVSVVEDITARKHAEEGLAAMHAELESRVETRTHELQESSLRWKQRNQMLSSITELTGLLSSARDEQEACRIATIYLPRIFPGTAGRIFLATADPAEFNAVAEWARPQRHTECFGMEDCWAVRRGQAYVLTPGEEGLRCRHFLEPAEQSTYVCKPLAADGRVIGVMSMQWPPSASVQYEANAVLVRTVVEQLALALVNARLRTELQAQAIRDPLTGLYNRRHLRDCVARQLSNARRDGASVAVLVVDVDHFKRFNDEFGHDVGDQVLCSVAAAINQSLREGDMAFRYGGEEFVALLHDATADAALLCAERLRKAVSDIQLSDRGQLIPRITCSVGVAACPQDATSAELLIRAADSALYAAKQAGRDRVQRAQPVPLQLLRPRAVTTSK